MAPKHCTSFELKVVTESVRIKVADISISDESGHRVVADADVDEMVSEFLGGQYYQTLLRKPSLRVVGGQPKLCSDGLRCLLDGKNNCGFEEALGAL